MDNPHILILEDDVIIRWHLQQILKSLEMTSFKSFDSFEQAEIVLLSETFNLIITNLKLEDGWVPEQFIKTCQRKCNLLIFLTGHNSNITSFLGGSGPVRILNKPFNEFQLRRLLKEFEKPV